MKERLIKDLILYMDVLELEKKYGLKLGAYLLDWDHTNYYAERASYHTYPNEFWTKVSQDPNLTFNFIDLYKSFLVWSNIDYSKWKTNLKFAREFADYIDWWKYAELFIANNDEETIREFINYIDFSHSPFEWNNPSLNFIREIKDKIIWFDTKQAHVNVRSGLRRTEIADEFAKEVIEIGNEEVAFSDTNIWYHVKLSKKLYNRFKRPYSLQSLIWHDVLDEDVLEEVVEQHKHDRKILTNILNRCTISEAFIEKISNIIDEQSLWKDISSHQILSEKFMDKYAKKLNWANLIHYQKLSEEFIEKHLDYMKGLFNKLVSSQKLSEQFLDKHFNLFNPIDIVRCQQLTEKFIEKHFENEYLKDIARKGVI